MEVGYGLCNERERERCVKENSSDFILSSDKMRLPYTEMGKMVEGVDLRGDR